MHASLRLTMTLLAASLVACGGKDDTSTGVGTDQFTTSGDTSSTGDTSSSSPTTTDGTTAGSVSGTQGTTGPDLTTSGPDVTTTGPDVTTTGPDLTSTGVDETTGPVTSDTDPDTSGSSTTGLPSECPPAPDDNPCAACSKENCCDEILACADDQDCACVSGCVQMMGDPLDCFDMCGVNPMMQNPQLGALRMCNMANCGEVCMMP